MLENLKRLREVSGTTQRQLAEAIGVSQQSVNKYENHNIEPDIETLIRIADYFNTSVDCVIGHGKERISSPDSDTLELSAVERELIRRYRLLNPKQRKCIETVIDSYI
jgi:transcriptional regulator with XRE-family HTH domain